jgi:teichoic acid glycerol-phosphate primase
MTESFLTSKNAAAILAGPRTSFLDHLIPLCHMWNIPLICTDPWVKICAETFYPKVEVIDTNADLFQKKLKSFETFVSVEPCKLHQRAFQFGEYIFQGHGRSISGFHGNPIKFREDYWIERYAHEDVVLIYGQYLKDYLQEKKVWERLKMAKIIGNVRKKFYERNIDFFNRQAASHLFPNTKRKTVFFATTWSFPKPILPSNEILDSLVANGFQTLVKLHPFMHRMFPEEVKLLKKKYSQCEHILFLDEIPIIYPLIAKADYYLGDESSVVFDFLSFNRPIFFLQGRRVPWAITLENGLNISTALSKKDLLSEKRKKAYNYVFQEIAV